MQIKYNKSLGLESGAPGGLKTSGFYKVKIKEALLIEEKEGTNPKQLVEFEFETENGVSVKFVSLLLWTRNKGDNFQAKHLHALIGLLRLQGIESDNNRFKTLEGKEVIVALQREDYTNKNGDDKYKFNIIGFCDPISKQTLEEREYNKEAKFITYDIVPIDSRNRSNGGASFGNSSFGGGSFNGDSKPIVEDDLPF